MSGDTETRRFSTLARQWPKRALPFAIAILCFFAVFARLDDVQFRDVSQAIGAVSPVQWLIACIATALSFAAVGQYDALFHRWLRTGVTTRRAVASGMAAIALAQTLGMGLATGTLARWRILPDISLPTALKITNFVSFSFVAGLGLLSVVVLALPGTGAIGTPAWSIAAVLIVLVAIVFSVAQPNWLLFSLPPLRMGARLMGLITLDVVAAAIAFWVLLPGEMLPAFPLVLAVFTLSLGAGLLSGTPGGVGPFELCLITLLPALPEPDLIATVLAFRLVYYALPAILAVVLLARPKPNDQKAVAPNPFPKPCDFARAERLLVTQPGHRLIAGGDGVFMHVAEASQTLVTLGDSVTGGPLTASSLAALARAASDGSRWPALYKCSAQTAGLARRHGWSVLPFSEEACIDLPRYTLETPSRRQLRRKLKSAAKHGVTIRKATSMPVAEMEEVAEEWAARMGGERGFSMGRFCPDHLSRQRCYLAYHEGRLVAFASFHAVQAEWTLDLMRSRSDTPNGTMHAVIQAAIEDARFEDVPRLSLAAMLRDDLHPLARSLLGDTVAQGLRRFKGSFAPQTERLYLAAPNSALLALTCLDLYLRINTPSPRANPFAEPRTQPLRA